VAFTVLSVHGWGPVASVAFPHNWFGRARSKMFRLPRTVTIHRILNRGPTDDIRKMVLPNLLDSSTGFWSPLQHCSSYSAAVVNWNVDSCNGLLHCTCSRTRRVEQADGCCGETRMKFNWTGQTTRLSTGQILYECSDCGVYVPKSGHLKKCDGPEGKIKRARITAQAFQAFATTIVERKPE